MTIVSTTPSASFVGYCRISCFDKNVCIFYLVFIKKVTVFFFFFFCFFFFVLPRISICKDCVWNNGYITCTIILQICRIPCYNMNISMCIWIFVSAVNGRIVVVLYLDRDSRTYTLSDDLQ